jgi:hypothetical protein
LLTLGLVRVLVVRPGSVAQDRFDKNGLTAFGGERGRNVLTLGDVVLGMEGFGLTAWEATGSAEQFRGQLKLRRVKRHYWERYNHDMSLTSARGGR